MSSSLSNNYVQVAGAGAGKTYQLANKLATESKFITDHKKIYAITFTNSAKHNIEKNLRNLLGGIPKNVEIDTIHSFLLNEIIYPFHFYIFNRKFNRAVSIPLPDKAQYKNIRLRQLNEKYIIHNEQVFKKSKMIIDKNNKNKVARLKIDTVLLHLEDSISTIFIDEAQDMNDDLFYLFTVLAELKIRIVSIQ